ncbi:MAG: hypothetical protein CVU81_01160 [Euryarchaeota archaeon HGW-Euryarchaeota-1]|nr:MAG: hypothetical protein CVU81_01160 [Euryarchaeota archaeon HGW-Euryarchaeota-1]PKP57388.1 MAG: hypothetical protein CVT88_08995 [Candidatus Altiarchaeales archaeon HGW-Altiarchaeales-1]
MINYKYLLTSGLVIFFVIFTLVLSGCVENNDNTNNTTNITNNHDNINKEPEISPDSLTDKCVKRAADIQSYEFNEIIKISTSGTMNLQIKIDMNGKVNLKAQKFFAASNFTLLNTLLQSEMYKIDDKIYYATVKDNKKDWKIYKKEDLEEENKFMKYAGLFDADADYSKKFTFLKDGTKKEIAGNELIDGQNCSIVKVYVNTGEVLKEKNLNLTADDNIENFELKLWISKNGDVMKEYNIMTLKGKNNAVTTIEKTILYKNYNQEVVINPPI